jgi:hypothetical protein
MTVERVTVALNQSLERVPISTEDALNDELIGVIQINYTLIRPLGRLRRLHDNRVTHFPRFGQCARFRLWLSEGRHVDKTKRPGSR